MKITDIIGQLEQISQAPCTSEEHKVAIEEACRILREHPGIETFTKVIEMLAAIAGIATYIQHIIT